MLRFSRSVTNRKSSGTSIVANPPVAEGGETPRPQRNAVQPGEPVNAPVADVVAVVRVGGTGISQPDDKPAVRHVDIVSNAVISPITPAAPGLKLWVSP